MCILKIVIVKVRILAFFFLYNKNLILQLGVRKHIHRCIQELSEIKFGLALQEEALLLEVGSQHSPNPPILITF